MKIIRSVQEMQHTSSAIIRQNKQIGFVATMGFLHEGHLSLMKQAKIDNDIVVASIFVNPLQFGPNEDFEQYPRDEAHDTRLAEEAGVDILFIPSQKEMYPKKMMISMDVGVRSDALCGRSRPGHFAGVATVVTKLFHIIQPQKAYFGMKDAQQVAIIDALIHDLNMPIQLIGLPIVREADGLSKSSRNVHLDSDERAEAAGLYKAIKTGQQMVVDGEKNPAIIVKEVAHILQRETNGTIDYVELLSFPDLQEIPVINQQAILATAVKFKHARLIDNIIFDENGHVVQRKS